MIIREIVLSYGKEITQDSKIINTPEGIYNLSKSLGIHSDICENFYVFCLNNKNVVVGYRKVSQGTVSETIVHPREIFIGAILNNSSSIIVVHNHPSGILTPSTEDLSATSRILEAGQIIGIPLLDHIIVGPASFLSMKEKNMF